MSTFFVDLAKKIEVLRNSSSGRHIIVGIDGVDGSGKTHFARKLCDAFKSNLIPADIFVISVDDFHNERKVRHRQGRYSAVGFFEDSFDYESLKSKVLNPIRVSEGRQVTIIPKLHDLIMDIRTHSELMELRPASIVIIEGIFLQRDELIDFLDLKIFLDVPFDESVRRMCLRDGTVNDQNHESLRRYVEGQKIYFERCSPKSRADFIVDNSDFESPSVVHA